MGKNGGARPGAGRKSTGTSRFVICLRPEEHRLLKDLGGSYFLQRLLQSIAAGDQTAYVRPGLFAEDQKEAFIGGMTAAGRISLDWPFIGKRKDALIPVTGADVCQWGAAFFRSGEKLVYRVPASAAASPVASAASVRSPAAALWDLAPYAETTIGFKR